LRAHEDIALDAAAGEQLRQHPVMAEAVDVVSDVCGNAEFLMEIALTQQRLPHERFAGRKVAVRLDPPPAGDVPATFRYTLANFLEHLRVDLFDPRVHCRRAGGEDKPVGFRNPIERGAERRPDLLEPLLPRPQPDWVDVGVTDEV